MATPNYGYEKRQKELAKKRRKEDKLKAKSERKTDGTLETSPEEGAGGPDEGPAPDLSDAPAQP